MHTGVGGRCAQWGPHTCRGAAQVSLGQGCIWKDEGPTGRTGRRGRSDRKALGGSHLLRKPLEAQGGCQVRRRNVWEGAEERAAPSEAVGGAEESGFPLRPSRALRA